MVSPGASLQLEPRRGPGAHWQSWHCCPSSTADRQPDNGFCSLAVAGSLRSGCQQAGPSEAAGLWLLCSHVISSLHVSFLLCCSFSKDTSHVGLGSTQLQQAALTPNKVQGLGVRPSTYLGA